VLDDAEGANRECRFDAGYQGPDGGGAVAPWSAGSGALGSENVRIGVIGAGGLGRTLAWQLADLGHEVSIANSAALRRALAEADPSRIADYRAGEEDRIRRSIARRHRRGVTRPATARLVRVEPSLPGRPAQGEADF
jgi:NADP oxidoreductase coenzyme F420-dependent